MLKRILVLNGPNLGRLGKREPHIYGSTTLADLEKQLKDKGQSLGLDVICFQSNHEGMLIDRIESAIEEGISGMILNAGGLTHTSIALADAIRGCAIPTIEVHLSQIYKREIFRHQTLTGAAAIAVITGMGTQGYHAALEYLAKQS
jgi:3-dehydroquinate dehydratase-2